MGFWSKFGRALLSVGVGFLAGRVAYKGVRFAARKILGMKTPAASLPAGGK